MFFGLEVIQMRTTKKPVLMMSQNNSQKGRRMATNFRIA